MTAEPGVRYRRRVVLEMVPEESALLRRLAAQHGTMRGAILAGLQLLEGDKSEELRTRIKTLERQLAAARTQATAAERASQNDQRRGKSESERKLAKVEAALAREQEARAGGDRARASATERVGVLKRMVEEEAARRIIEMQCPSCEKLVPEAEWAEQGADIYHEEHGYRPKYSFVHGGATVMARRHSGAARAAKAR
jgi:hypothetical protein